MERISSPRVYRLFLRGAGTGETVKWGDDPVVVACAAAPMQPATLRRIQVCY